MSAKKAAGKPVPGGSKCSTTEKAKDFLALPNFI
jgi:hypothetical protein